MKFGIVLAFSLLLQTASTSVFAQDSTSAQFEPEPGFVCDRQNEICRDGKGPNFQMTRVHFGDEAAVAALEREQIIADLEGMVFTPEIGVSCNLTLRICYDKLQLSIAHTQHYFDDYAIARLRTFETLKTGSSERFEPMAGNQCLRKIKICYDQQGPDVALTRLFFGHETANRLLGALLKQRHDK